MTPIPEHYARGFERGARLWRWRGLFRLLWGWSTVLCVATAGAVILLCTNTPRWWSVPIGIAVLLSYPIGESIASLLIQWRFPLRNEDIALINALDLMEQKRIPRVPIPPTQPEIQRLTIRLTAIVSYSHECPFLDQARIALVQIRVSEPDQRTV